MKNAFLMIALCTTLCSIAQDKLIFDMKFTKSEDKWVAFKADSVGSHTFGFIYIDPSAGLTFDYEGSFTIDGKGKFLLKKKESQNSIKYRLEPNATLVAVIPESHFSELNISKFPEWLKIYKEDENTIAHLYKWGYLYNGWGECKKALEFLEKAKQYDPEFKGLRVELAFSYNCLGRFKDAIKVLKMAILRDPNDAYICKELLYSQVHNDQLEEAIMTYDKIVEKISDKTYNSENAYNILGAFYRQGKLEQFVAWLNKTKVDQDRRFGADIEKMKKNLSK